MGTIINHDSNAEEKEIEKDEIKDIDKTLYLIKELNFDKNKVKKDLDLDFEIDKYYDKNDVVIILNGVSYHIFSEARKIQFINGTNVIEKFVYSDSNLSEILKKLGFEFFTFSGNEDNSYDSIESQIGQEEIYNIFKNASINQITKINSELQNIIDKFRIRYSKNIKLISDLSLNACLYYPENKNDIINFKLLNKYFDELKKILCSERNVTYLSGPKGTSKSLFLLNFSFELNEIEHVPLLYINYRELMKLTPNQKKSIFNKEVIYLFFNENYLNDFYKSKSYGEINEKGLISFLYDFILNLLRIYENTFNKYILFVIDNFDDEDENTVKILKNIISLAKKAENIKKIKLIISGRCAFIYKMQNHYFNNKLDNFENFVYYNVEMNNKKDKNSLPLFHFKKFENNINEKDELLKEEIKFCDKFNLYGMYYSLLHCNKEVNLDELNQNYDILPFDFLVFNKSGKKKITFHFHNEIFKSSVKRKIRTEIERNHLQYFIKKLKYSRITDCIFEEKLLTLFFSFNKLGIQNLHFKEENRLEVKEINKLKETKFLCNNIKLDLLSPVIITQENFLGPNYDLLILIPSINTSFLAYFMHIGTNINKSQIEDINEDLSKNEGNYKNGIENYTGLKISKIELVFIFDKETQVQIKKENDKNNSRAFTCVNYCRDNKILFYLFSTVDYTLYSTPDMKGFNKVINFGKIRQKRPTYIFSFRNNIDLIFSDDEIKNIGELIDNDIYLNYIMIRDVYEKEKEYKEAKMKFDEENIYVFQNSTDKIFVIKNKHYIMENNKLKLIKNINNNSTIQDFKYKEIITLKDRNYGEKMKVFHGEKKLKNE